MATWQEVRAHLAQKYQIAKDEPNWIGLGWKVPTDKHGELTQHQRVEPVTVNGETWILVWSPIVEINRVPPLKVLERNMTFVIGSIAIHEGLYVFRAVLPLEGLDWKLFDANLEAVARESAVLKADAPVVS